MELTTTLSIVKEGSWNQFQNRSNLTIVDLDISKYLKQ